MEKKLPRVEKVSKKLLFSNNHVPEKYQPKTHKKVKFKDSMITHVYDTIDGECKSEEPMTNTNILKDEKRRKIE